jgi:hypothetical protein
VGRVKALALVLVALVITGCGHSVDQRAGAQKRLAAAYHACAKMGLTGAFTLSDHEQTISGVNLDISYANGNTSDPSADTQALACMIEQLRVSHALGTQMFGIDQTGTQVENGVRYRWKVEKSELGSRITLVATTLN